MRGDIEPEPMAAEPHTPRVIHVCAVDVDPGLMSEVRAGVDGWRYATRGWRAWEWSRPCELFITEVDEGEVCDMVANACTVIGRLERPGVDSWVYLVRGKYERGTRLAVLHEIGHALGLDHTDGGIMQAVTGPLMWEAEWQCPDPVTIARLEWHTGATGLRSCGVPIPGLR